MLTKHTAYKYENPYKGPFVITRCWKNVMVSLQCGGTEIRYNIRDKRGGGLGGGRREVSGVGLV